MVLCKINQACLMKVSLVLALFNWDDRYVCRGILSIGHVQALEQSTV